MARVKEISVMLERKASDGNFGSLGYSVTETVSLERDDDPKEEYLELKRRVARKASVLDKELGENIRAMHQQAVKKSKRDD